MNEYEFLSYKSIRDMHIINNEDVRKVDIEKITSNSEHHQTFVAIDNGKKLICCDEGVGELIMKLNAEGFVTYNSCQGGKDNYPYVHMEMPESLDGYLRASNIVRKFWQDKYIEVRMDPLNFAVSFYAKSSIDEINDINYTYEPLISEEKSHEQMD